MRYLILRAVVALGVLIPGVAVAQESCKAPTETTKPPAVSALFDSASLIANLPAPDLAASKEVIVSVTTGPTPRAVVMDTVAAKTESGKALAQRVVAALKPNAITVLSAFRLRVLLGEAPALSILGPVVCPPEET
ncbi:MAG TPA: hypothetical protein VF128_05685 [Gemmatimonadaceae bacterium]